MNSAPVKIAVLAAVAIAATVLAVRGARPKLPPLDRDLHEAMGRVLGEETARLLGHRGNIVVVAPEADFDMPLVASQLRGFRNAIARHAGIKVAAEETVRLEQMGPLDGLLTAQRYEALAERHGSDVAIVSFVGLGAFGDADLARWGASPPPLIVISLNADVPVKLYDRRVVRVAIVPRFGEPPAQATPGREAFERGYEVLIAGENI